MGYLKVGTPLSWEKVDKIKASIRLYGLLQFIHIFNCNKNREDTNLMFGDEIEYIILKNDETIKESSLLLCASDLIDAMMNLETNNECLYGSHWTPEYASYIIEGTPAMPFKFELNSSVFVEHCIRNRRAKLNNFLSYLNGVRAVTLPCFPNILLENSYLIAKQTSSDFGSKVFPNSSLSSIINCNSSTSVIGKECDEINGICATKQYNRNNENEKSSHEVVTFAKKVNFKKGLTNETKQIYKEHGKRYRKGSFTESEDKSSHLSTVCMAELEEYKYCSMVNSEVTLQKGEDIYLQENEGEEKYKRVYTEDIETEEGKKIQDNTNDGSETNELEKLNNGQIGVTKGNAFFRCEIFKPEYINKYTKSCLVSDLIISPHPRYVSLTQNIRMRRGAKIVGFTPIYQDKYTNCLNIWKDSLDSSDLRLFKKKKKKYVLEEHLIWNKSMLNTKGNRPALEKWNCEKKEVMNEMQECTDTRKRSEIKIKGDEEVEEKVTDKDIREIGGSKIFDRVMKHSFFSNVDDEEDYIYIYNRKFIEVYSLKTQNPVKNYIYVDAMCFGMGMCCQQVTISCSTLKDARYLYDQLAVIAPLFLALTAATPYLRGFLTDTDTRWRAISNSVDCRTEEEMSYLSKPRYSGISLYISNELPLKNKYYYYNDIDVVLDKYVYEKLKRESVDDFLARHISTLFVRDPLVVFEGAYNETDVEKMEQMRQDWKDYVHDNDTSNSNNDNSTNSNNLKNAEENGSTSLPNPTGKNGRKLRHPHTIFLEDNFAFLEEYEESVLSSNQHFESFQSTNWNSVRFKPPPISDSCFTNKSSIGWRVEFRTPDIQITDFENACVVTLIVVLSKFIIEERLNLYIPMSLLEENLFRSANRDAIIKEKFFFRKDLKYNTDNDEVEEKSIYDIFFNENNGMFHLCANYVEKKYKEGKINHTAKNKIDEYIEFIKLRCNGQISTDAAYLRNFILNHPAYEQNSFINSKINYDVCKLITDIGKGLIIPVELLGVFVDPYKERIKSDIKQINESQYLNSLAYRFISGEDYTQYLLLSEHVEQDNKFKTETIDTRYDDLSDGNKLEFEKILYEFSA